MEAIQCCNYLTDNNYCSLRWYFTTQKGGRFLLMVENEVRLSGDCAAMANYYSAAVHCVRRYGAR